MYNEKVMEHFLHPKNMGSISKPDGKGRAGNPVCGDVLEIQINVKKEKGKEIISDIKFQTLGCGAAIATSSMITELAKGKTLKEAEKISRKDVADSLGGLPPIKMHCSNLASEALQAAIKDYKKKNKK